MKVVRIPLHLNSVPGTAQSDDIARIELHQFMHHVSLGKGFRHPKEGKRKDAQNPSKKKMENNRHMMRNERIALQSFGEKLSDG